MQNLTVLYDSSRTKVETGVKIQAKNLSRFCELTYDQKQKVDAIEFTI